MFVRRMDDQVKIDGFRIELAEIETVFATHKLVDKAGMHVCTMSLCRLKLYFRDDSMSLTAGWSIRYFRATLNCVTLSQVLYCRY